MNLFIQMTQTEGKTLDTIDKLIKVISDDDRIFIGKLKCIDNYCNLFISESVELFDKNSDLHYDLPIFHPVDLEKDEHLFYFETEKYQYQMYGPLIIPGNKIKKVIELK